jgi:PfaD family protein
VSLTGDADGRDTIAQLPGQGPEKLGSPAMVESHGVRMAYVSGEMANGIATVEMVASMARHGMLGFFGAAGLSLERIEAAVSALQMACRGRAWGSNLIHSPSDPELEEATVGLYLRHAVRRVSASAFMKVRPSIVRYAATGLRRNPDGSIHRANRVFAKLSRPEVAAQFLSPAPDQLLDALVLRRAITPEEAQLAKQVPVADHITVEADSGGHTDNRPLAVLLPSILTLAEEMRNRFGWKEAPWVGAAGGIGTPSAVAGAFAMGAAYVLTGSINQCARESGQGLPAKKMLAQADLADIMMAPAGDMFELGVRVQVLKRGCMFPLRASKLYELYRNHASLEDLPEDAVASLERDYFRQSIARTWEDTRRFFLQNRPSEVQRAEREPKHRMALVFRWYLGLSSKWPIEGDAGRQMDYQIWCGPAMGAFNRWAAGSFLENIEERTVTQIALNLMHGAASIARAHQLRTCGIRVPDHYFTYRPRPFVESSPSHAH